MSYDVTLGGAQEGGVPFKTEIKLGTTVHMSSAKFLATGNFHVFLSLQGTTKVCVNIA